MAATKKTFYDTTGNFAREFFIGPAGNTLIIIHDILYFNVLGDSSDIQAIDPEGGPFIGIGFKIDDWIIDQISCYTKINHKRDEDNDWLPNEYTLVVNCMSKRAT